ncbi:MAG: GntR family transcriptional regulator [Fimbriimonadaceae bacterium]|nr:GntR family transcriptional regulator [Chitinophagales bacterium]
MLNIGNVNTLTILRITSVGMYLSDEENNEVLLPNKYILPEFKVGNEAEVFIYKDSEERLIATTLEPFIKLNEFAFLQVKESNQVGAFLNWGLEKDLFVPFKEQPVKMIAGKRYVVYLYLDAGTERLTASGKIYKFLDNSELEIQEDDTVDLLIYKESAMGFSAIINNKYDGLIYHNEIFQEIYVGDKIKGYIKSIREDHKIDLRLQQSGYKNIEPNSEVILKYLQMHNGFLDLNDKSDPEEISQRLSMSKKTFKKAIGGLYKQQLIELRQDGIYLL